MAIDTQQVITRVRFLLGNPSQEVITDEILLSIADECVNEIGSEDDKYCLVVQCTLMESLRYLIRQNQASSGVNGNVRKRQEKVGKRTIQVEYGDSSDIVTDGWQQMHDDYLNNPSWICKELASSTTLVIIGGVEQTEYDRVHQDPNARDAYQLNINKKYNRKTSLNRRRRTF